MRSLIFGFFLFTPFFHYGATPSLTCELSGRLGNNLFQIAAVMSVALDHGASLYCPDLQKERYRDYHKHILYRISKNHPSTPSLSRYNYRDHHFKPIPYIPNTTVAGLFQSEKYFKRHREKMINLFSPSNKIKIHLNKNYKKILSHPKTVAIHVRCYYPFCNKVKPRDGKGILPFIGFNYFKNAVKHFPDDSLFVVFSDNMPLCTKNLKRLRKNMIFIQNETFYHDFYLMSFCKNQIISNSSFSWWAAYLNPNPNKVVICPDVWYEPARKVDGSHIVPDDWRIEKT